MAVFVTGTLEPYASGNFRVIDDTFTFLLGLGVDISTGTDLAPDYPRASYQGTLHRWDLTAKTPSVGASIILDVFYSTDGGSTWTSLWPTNQGNRPTITASSKQAGGTAFDTTTYAAGTLFRVDVIQTGTTTKGQGILLKLV